MGERFQPRADYNFFVSHNKNEPESLSNPNYLVEKVGEYTETRVSDRQRRPDRCMTNLETSQQIDGDIEVRVAIGGGGGQMNRYTVDKIGCTSMLNISVPIELDAP